MSSYWRVILRLVLLFVVAFGLGSLVEFGRAVTVPLGKADQKLAFELEQGQGARDIVDQLNERGFKISERSFYLYLILTGQRTQLYPGQYTIDGSMTIRTLVDTLTDEKSRQIVIRVLEGWRIKDIAKAVAEKTEITAKAFEAAAPVEEYEGYLFPDTYFFAQEATAEQIVKRMRETFDQRTKDLNLTAEDIILASIVEREARLPEDRPKVARVYRNRLAIGMALEADPTVQYAKGSWDPITLADYRSVISPYNTYLNRGLPPTPIANPGLASLQAVKSDLDHDFFYFFHTSDGQSIYSKTFEEHNANKRKYLR